MDVTTNGVYVITGGGGAIAGAVAEVFAAAGARLALVDVSVDAVRERAASLGALPLAADLRSLAAATAMAASVRARFGRIDGLVHTAGGFAMAAADAGDEALYERLFDVNVRTLFCAVRALLPAMLEEGGGFVAGLSSSAAWEGGAAGMALYAAAKGAVATYLRSLEKELRGRGVRVGIVYPLAPVDTPANRREMPEADPATWVDAAEIGRALLFAATRSPRGRLFELPIGTAG